MKNTIQGILIACSLVITTSSFAFEVDNKTRKEFFTGMYTGCFDDVKKSQPAAKAKSFCKCMVNIYETNMSNKDVGRIMDIALSTKNFTADDQFMTLATQSGKECT